MRSKFFSKVQKNQAAFTGVRFLRCAAGHGDEGLILIELKSFRLNNCSAKSVRRVPGHHPAHPSRLYAFLQMLCAPRACPTVASPTCSIMRWSQELNKITRTVQV